MIKDKIINLLAKFEGNELEKSFPLDYCLPVYHCISNENLPHLKQIIQYKNVKQFEEDLDYFSKYFQFVNWSEFKDFIKGNFKPKKRIALLTFDDGFREFYDVVIPILERKGIYAINFINPAFIDNNDLMFRCKASLLINELEKKQNINPEIYQILQLKDHSKVSVRKQLLNINYSEKTALNQIAELAEIDFNQFLKEQKPYLNFEQLNSLSKKGFGISAHSWDHPLYSELSLQKQLETTKNTFNYLKNNNFLSESFAFPFTDFLVETVFFDHLFQNEDVFCSFGCAGIKLDSVDKNFQRIPMETGESAQTTIKKEVAYFRFKKLFNKNTIIRR